MYGIDELACDVARVPAVPGVYVFRAGDGRALYVGKSRNLRARLASYFQPGSARLRKVRALQRVATAVTIEPTGSDFAALLREIDLVQTLEPPYNRRLRRHERYTYLAVDYRDRFPRLTVTATPPAGARVLGPFTPHARVADAVALVSDAFRLRTCEDPHAPGASTHCWRLQLHSCSAPCLGSLSPGAYGREFLRTLQVISGGSKVALADLVAERDRLAAAERFEEAARRQRLIASIEMVRRRLFINRVWRDTVVAVQPGAVRGTVHLWGIAGSAVCAEAITPPPGLGAALERIHNGLQGATADALALIPQDELDTRWVVHRWLRSADGRRWSVPTAGASADAVLTRVRALACEALGLFFAPVELTTAGTRHPTG